MPSSTDPSDLVSAAAAPGRTLARVTDGTPSTGSIRVSGALAAGTNSRNAISSVSAARPENGRVTIMSAASGAPWQALNRRPDPHGQGRRGLNSAARAVAEALSAVASAVAEPEERRWFFLDTRPR